MNTLRLIILILLLGAFASSTLAQDHASGAPDSGVARGLALLDEANTLNQTNDPDAIARYREAAAVLEFVRTQGGIQNAALNHAIGNAYLNSDEIGHAILAYRRSLALDPTNQEARQSLEHARSLVGSNAPPSRSHRALRALLSWRGHLARPTMWNLASVCFLIGFVLVGVRFVRPSGRWTAAAILGLACSIGSFSALALDRWESKSLKAGVLIADSVIARTGPSARVFDPVFQTPLESGVEFVAIDHREGWVQIQLASNALAWVPQESVEMISGTRTDPDSSTPP